MRKMDDLPKGNGELQRSANCWVNGGRRIQESEYRSQNSEVRKNDGTDGDWCPRL